MNAKLWFRFILMGLMLSALVLAGCDDGDDGRNGADGASAYEIAVENGFDGTEEEWLDSLQGDTATTAEPEQCAVCHSDVAAIHTGEAVSGDFEVTNVDLFNSAGGLDITFNVELDGDDVAEYDIRRAYAYYDGNPEGELTKSERSTFLRESLQLTGTVTFESDDEDAAGDPIWEYDVEVVGVSISEETVDGRLVYTVVVPDSVQVPSMNTATLEPDPETITFDEENYVIDNAVYFVQLTGADGTRPVVVAENGKPVLRDLVENTNCGDCHGNFVFNDGHYTVDAKYCQVCHVRDGRSFNFYTQDAAGDWSAGNGGDGNNLTIYVHGIHNSHNMPAGEFARNEREQFSVGYPSDMKNCVSCHSAGDQLDAAVEAPVEFYLCMSCHQDWDGFGDTISETKNSFHLDMGLETDCMNCHGEVPSLDEAGDFHNAILDSARENSFYRGVNISFANADDVDFEVTGVDSDGSNVSFTWTASDSSGAVNPCNTDTANGPTFQGVGAYLAYAKGDDWVNEFVGSSPGQPVGSAGLFDDLTTTCADNVATTSGLVLDPDATYAEKVLLALGGKPFANFSTTGDDYAVRVTSPTQAFDPATGDFVADRRDAVNNDKCLGCHQGTLYQHGGDRVDNEQLCVICHNPAASDKNVRIDSFAVVNEDGTVNTDATYDGKNAETYDMRTMLHAIHGVEARLATGGKPWVVYRGRGIYGFGLDDTPLPEGWPADGETVNGSTNDGTTPHNWVVVHYPKAVNDCEACHDDGKYEAADQTKAVGVTVDAGFDWPDQSDDTIIGPSAAACTACHAGAAQRSHAQSNGYKAKVTKDEMLEKAN